MCNEDHGEIHPVPDLVQEIQDLCLNRYIKGRDRFVRNKDIRLERKRTGDTDPLPLSAREFVRKTVIGTGIETHDVQQVQSPFFGILRTCAIHDWALRDDLSDPGTRVERCKRVLKHHLDL